MLFPNCLVLEEEAASHSHQPHHPVQQRTLHNAATTLHVCDWLADPTRERLQCHLLNLATMRLHASWEEVAEAGPGGQREGASMDASCSTDGEREVFVAGALGAGGRGGGSSQRWSSGSWCYSRLEQTWGPHALRTLGITRRSVTQFLLELQVQKEQGLPLVGDKECLLTRGAAE